MDEEESIGVFYDLITYLIDIREQLITTKAELTKTKINLAAAQEELFRLDPSLDPTWIVGDGWFDDEKFPPPKV